MTEVRSEQPETLRDLAWRIRHHSLMMTHRAGSSHIGTNLSMADLLAVLYGKTLRIDPARPDWDERDRFILSKGHGCAALYAALAERGFFPVQRLESFYGNGCQLAGHATHTSAPGIEVSTGSLGHGLPLGTGISMALRRSGSEARIFVMMSDGECDEGSTWESILFSAQHGLDNLVAVVDYNKIQSLGSVREVMDLEPFADKWQAFGWSVREIDGHDLGQIEQALTALPLVTGQPTCVIAHTVKGKGVSFMENDLLWHYRTPQGEELERALTELQAAR